MKAPERYRVPPKRAYRAMGLGVLNAAGQIKVVAGFRFRWWELEASYVPLFVHARVLRIHSNDGTGRR